jgi:predicted transcriptional regulator
MTQIKVPPEIKKEIATFASLTDRTQSELMVEAWREYRARHSSELREGLKWAEEVLSDPEATAVSAAGMESNEIEMLSTAFEEDPQPGRASRSSQSLGD